MVTPIDRGRLLELIDREQAQIVNVLPSEEYDEEHIPGSVSIPLSELTAEIAARLSSDRPVVTYCHNGL